MEHSIEQIILINKEFILMRNGYYGKKKINGELYCNEIMY